MESRSTGRPELVARAKGGDGTAFDELVHPELPRLARFAAAIVGNEADARDALQDTLAIAWRKIPSLREAERFPAWIIRILVNECHHLVGRRRNRAEVPVPEEGLSREASAGPEGDAASLDVLERAFSRLDGHQRALLVLHHLEHQPIDQIAAAMAIPTGTVKSQLFAARTALKAALAKEDSDGDR